jgi:hypothetical protein
MLYNVFHCCLFFVTKNYKYQKERHVAAKPFKKMLTVLCAVETLGTKCLPTSFSILLGRSTLQNNIYCLMPCIIIKGIFAKIFVDNISFVSCVEQES